MFGKNKGSSLWKPKKLHSLGYLKYLYSVLLKNTNINEQNSETVVEAIRLIAEILIWGDQNDTSVMDFFLEKNMLEYFFQVIKQNSTRTVCVQVLQTLNILFENISNKTAVYYLLSNNHTNEIITHRFDFSDEEVVAYYISFLKTLSFRLDSHTINFFYLEQRREFDLYVEAIKLFCHPESMVRIAVRTITLNVHRVKDEGALEFIHHQTSLPYFSYLVWSVGNTVLDIDDLLHSDLSPQNKCKLEDLIAEHVDHLHYLNDLLSLGIEGINEVLCDQLLQRLLIPLYVYSLTKRHKNSVPEASGIQRPHVTRSVAIFVLTHVFVILHHVDLVRVLMESIFIGDPSLTDLVPWNDNGRDDLSSNYVGAADESLDLDNMDEVYGSTAVDPILSIAECLITSTGCIRSARAAPSGSRLEAYLSLPDGSCRRPEFSQPRESLEASLRNSKGVTPALLRSIWPSSLSPLRLSVSICCTQETPLTDDHRSSSDKSESLCDREKSLSSSNSLASDTDKPVLSTSPVEEKLGSSCSPSEDHEIPIVPSRLLVATSHPPSPPSLETTEHRSGPDKNESEGSFDLQGRPFLRALFRILEVGPGTDYDALFALLLFMCIRVNKGVDLPTLRLAKLSEPVLNGSPPYDNLFVSKLLDLISDACKSGSRVRLITLQLTMCLTTELVCDARKRCFLSDSHFAQIVSAREEAMMVLRSYFQNNVIFLDLFERELYNLQNPLISPVKLAMDPALLIPPQTTFTSPNSATAVGDVRWDHWRRIPQSDVQHTQRAIGVYLMLHIWLESLLRARPGEHEDESVLDATTSEAPCLTVPMFSSNLPVDLSTVPGITGFANIPDPNSPAQAHKAGDKLDLSSEALIGCTVESEGRYEKRFLVNYSQQLVLVEPDSRQIGWGVITFIGPLQDMDATCDPADSRCLHVTINNPGRSISSVTKPNVKLSCSSLTSPKISGNTQGSATKPLLAARFLFEDHIRCMTARQMLVRGREWARQSKLRKVAALIDFSPQFIHDNFAFPGSNTAECNAPSSLDDREPNKSQSDPHVLRGSTTTRNNRTAVSRNPGAFLMERQSHRAKIHQRLHAREDFVDTHGAWNAPRPTSSYSAQEIRVQRPVAHYQPQNRLLDFVSRTPISLVQQRVSPRLNLPSIQFLEGTSSEQDNRTPVNPATSAPSTDATGDKVEQRNSQSPAVSR